VGIGQGRRTPSPIVIGKEWVRPMNTGAPLGTGGGDGREGLRIEGPNASHVDRRVS
jgi:hypothetical protein